MNRTSNARKQNSAVISHLTACQMALAVTSGLSKTCAVSRLVTHYINARDHRNLRTEASNAPSWSDRDKQTTTTTTTKICKEIPNFVLKSDERIGRLLSILNYICIIDSLLT
jgi:hypothetical protein